VICKDASTMMGAVIFGSTCWIRIRRSVPPIALAACTNSPFAHGQHLPAHETRIGRHADDTDRQHDIGQARAQDRCQGQRQHQDRECQQGIHEAHEPVVEHPPDGSGQQAQSCPGHQRDANGDHPDLQRHASTPHDPAEHIPTEVIRAQEMLATGTLQKIAKLLLGGIVRRQKRCQSPSQHDREDEPQSHARQCSGVQTVPEGTQAGFIHSGCAGLEAHR
jgi:hypothetical protein